METRTTSAQKSVESTLSENGAAYEAPAPFIKLDQFLKVTNVAQSGGHAKLIIRNGEVTVNGEMELRRGRKLYDQDVVMVDGISFTVEHTPPNLS